MSKDEISEIKELIRDLGERNIQDRSAHHSDLLKLIASMQEKIENIEKELSNWKFGSKIGVTILIGIGAVVTWILNTLGVKLWVK